MTPLDHRRQAWSRLTEWYQARGGANRLAALLSVLALGSALYTYAILGEAGSSDVRTVYWLLNFNILVFLLLLVVLAERLVALWLARRANRAGSKLHRRLVVLISVVAALPAIIMACFSIVFFQAGVQSWFDTRVKGTVETARQIAQAYLNDQSERILRDAQLIAADLEKADLVQTLRAQPRKWDEALGAALGTLELSEAAVFDRSGRLVGRAGLTFALQAVGPPPELQRRLAELQDRQPAPQPQRRRNQPPPIALLESPDRVRAAVQLERFPGLTLIIGRARDPKVLAAFSNVQASADEYDALEQRRAEFQISVTLLFGLLAAMFLGAGITLALIVAGSLIRPLATLITAAERMRAGDLSARLAHSDRQDEFGTLMRSFNRMADQLEAQQSALMDANAALERRRRFIETVLRGVSAGVLGLDRTHQVVTANRSAATLMAQEPEALAGADARSLMPGLSEDLARFGNDRSGAVVTRQIQFLDAERRRRTLLVRMVPTGQAEDDATLVLTFDDITELLAAQRHAAWSDTARRIAHEIKNPLTPIQLSAERLKRRYLKQIQDGPETFELCIDTIGRQVETIRRLVDEFSAFARMPQPQLKPEDLRRLVGEAAFAQRQSSERIRLDWLPPAEPVMVLVDAGQLTQALLNLTKNAAEALAEQPAAAAERPDRPPPVIRLQLRVEGGRARILVADNGPGIPADLRERVLDPYVTTREKGTGLGLAIVRKIIEDHGGSIALHHPDAGGLEVELSLPLAPAAPAPAGASGSSGELLSDLAVTGA